jgi:hypothetical protein
MAEDLLSLISAGKIEVGTVLYHAGRQDRTRAVTAVVVDRGLRVRGQIYPTPSAAAKVFAGRPVDGWIFWRLPNGELLDAMRSEHRRPA